MTGAHPGFERRALSALEAAPSRIPVVLGGCGTGRTPAPPAPRRVGRSAAQYVDVERCATTPERFLQAVTGASPFPVAWSRPPADHRPRGVRPAARVLRHGARTRRRALHVPARRSARAADLRELSGPSSRPSRSARRRSRPARIASSSRPVTSRGPTACCATPRRASRSCTWLRAGGRRRHRHARARVQRLRADADRRSRLPRPRGAGAHRRPRAYVRAIGDTMARLGRGADPISALTALLAPDGALNHWCQFCYELRLHRARGYGALKAILDILADEEPLTLTEISHRLRRTPGSTKDYLSWLEDVDLVTSRQKRYSFTDPVLRLWVRLHCRPTPPSRRGRRARSAALRPRPSPRSRNRRRHSPTPASTRRRKSARAGESSRYRLEP